MDDFPAWFWPVFSLCVGAAASYFGAQTAMSVKLARLEEQNKHTHDTAMRALNIADEAHDRINELIRKRTIQ